MLWLLVILLIAGLSFVLFHKPHVNSMGAGWTPPQRRPQPPAKTSSTSEASAEDAITLRLARHAAPAEDAVTLRLARQPAPQAPDTFDLNELFGGRAQDPTDRPNA